MMHGHERSITQIKYNRWFALNLKLPCCPKHDVSMNIKIRHNVSNISKDGNLPGKEIYSSPLLKIITPTSGECSDHQLYHTCYHSCELSFFLRIYFVATVMANCCNHFHSPGTLLMGRGLGPSRAIKVLSGKELYFLYLMRQMVLVEFFIKKPWWSSFHTCEQF